MSAYQEMFLNSAMHKLGEMFDYAINDFGIDREDYPLMFASSRACLGIERGEPRYLLGMSGVELAYEVVLEMTGIEPVMDPGEEYDRSPDYWCGWSLSYYQWLRECRFRDILRAMPYESLISLYGTLHEADIMKTVELLDEKLAGQSDETNLKHIRASYGCSQSELARMSGVSLRSIQMYEQRNKDINKAQAVTLMNLALVLGCHVEDLLERKSYHR